MQSNVSKATNNDAALSTATVGPIPHNIDATCEDKGLAKHLLEIKNGARWEPEYRDELTVVKFFEPKFAQVFLKYCEGIKQTIHTSGHFMSFCLENLIPFCCWARENSSRMTWIKEALEDSADLRPEVRNGLSMIFIYALAAAKSATIPDRDMFAVLQDEEHGLGVINKTSLKIYHDPYFFYTFLKCCMSGLIDAGKIPENERQNQPKKPKRQSDNKEELVAFLQMKSVLVPMLDRGEIALARAKIQQISEVWQERHKNIRNNWFITALAILSSPNNLKLSQLSGEAGTSMSLPLVRSYDLNGFGVQQPLEGGYVTQFAAPYTHDVSASILSLAVDGTQPASSSSAIDASRVRSHAAAFGSSSSSDHHPHLQQREAHPARSLQSHASFMPGLRLFPSVPAVRLERVGSKEWDCRECKIFNIESLVLQSSSSFFLIDEARLTPDEHTRKKLFSQSAGFVSVQMELQQRGALVATWPKADHKHMLDFLESWMAQTVEVPLLEHWNALLTASKSSLGGNSSLQQQQEQPQSVPRGRGLLAYETIMQAGIVLRSSTTLGIQEDCWRLLYPKDLYINAPTASLAIFLCSFFPQLRTVFGRLHAAGMLGSIVVKYHAHRINPPVMQAPGLAVPPAYQTIGCLDDQCGDILARFDTTTAAFHDLVFMSI